MDNDFPVVFSYSRAQAIADGVLVDVSAAASEAGFKVPVALTHGAWAECVSWGEGDDRHGALGQSEAGRLWDVLFIARRAALLHRDSERNRVAFVVLRVPRGGRRAERAELVVHIGPGDQGEPVLTVLLPNEG